MSISIRPARSTDAGKAGEILHRFNRETPWMPKLHTEAETIAFCGAMIDRGWMTVAECDGQVVGFLARDGEEICALYLRPEIAGLGVGRQLLNAAKARSRRLRLWVFQENRGAQRFYRREGFREADRTNGSRNDENLPDIAYVWTRAPETGPTDPDLKKQEQKADDPRPGSD